MIIHQLILSSFKESNLYHIDNNQGGTYLMAYQSSSYKKFIAGTVSAAVVATALTPVAAADKTFPDVEKLADETKTAIYTLAEDGVINGKANGTFDPFGDINRSQTAEMLVKYLGLSPVENGGDVFADLSSKSYATPYAEALEAAGILDGSPNADGTKDFNAGSPLYREQMAKILVNALGLTDTGEDIEIKDLANASEDQKTYIKILAQHGLTKLVNGNFNPKETVKRSQFALFLYRASQLNVEAEIAGFEAVGAKKLEVTFKSAVDVDKAEIAIKEGTSNLGIASLTFADDAKSAVVELNNKLTAGTYTVNVSGVSEETQTAETKVEDEKVSAIELTSENAIITDTDKAEVGYTVVNQYGEDITSSTDMYTIEPTATNGYSVTSATAGTVKVTKSGAESGDKFTLTLIDSKSAKSVSKEITVSDKAVTTSVDFAGIYNADALSLNEDNKSEEFFLTLKAKDQYGTDVTEVSKLDEDLLVFVSNPSVLDVKEFTTYEDKDENEFTALALEPKAAGESIITIISKANGVLVSYKVTVDAGFKLDTVSLGTPEGLVAGKDTVLVPLTVKDNKGNTVTDETKVEGKLAFEGTGYTNAKVINKDGSLFVELVADATATKASLVLTVQSETDKYDTEVVTVNPTATADAIIGLKSYVSTRLYAGETLELSTEDFVVQDQYGRNIDTTAEGFNAVITATDSDNETLSVSGLDITAGDVKGTEAVTFAIENVEDSATDVTFRIVDRSEFVSYEVADLTVLHANATNAFADGAEDAYTQNVLVYGITADGEKVKLPASEYSVYETSEYVNYEAGVIDGLKDNDDSKIFEGTAQLVVTINETGDEFTKEVTISEATPKVEKVEYQVELKAVTAIDFDGVEFDKADLTGVIVTDNYGVEKDGSTAIDRVTFTNVEEKEGNEIAITANGTGTASLSNLEAGDTFDATIVIDGKSLTVTVTVK